jgi:hypothetical protein
MAGLALALLLGREEDQAQALPAEVVQLIVEMLGTYTSFGPTLQLPYVQGLAELAVSDANKVCPRMWTCVTLERSLIIVTQVHLVSLPGAIDSLQTGLCIGSTAAADPSVPKLRAYCCQALAQLAASQLTLPLVLGHPVLEDLARVGAGRLDNFLSIYPLVANCYHQI